MATSKEELRRQIALLADRDDIATQESVIDGETVDYLSIFIRDAEKRAYRDEVTRIPPFEFVQEHTLAAGDTSFQAPLGYLEIRYVEAVTAGIRTLLTRTSVSQIRDAAVDDRVDINTEFAYGSNTFYVRPSSSETTVRVYYYGELTPINDLTGEVTNHYLLNSMDDLIRYYAAIFAAEYYNTDALKGMIQTWEARAKQIRDDIIMQDVRARTSGTAGKIGRFYRNAPRISPNTGSFGGR